MPESTIQSDKYNLSEELLKLLIVTAQIARAIRLNSAYSPTSKNDPATSVNVWELSECLHNFDQLSIAIRDNDIEGVNRMCGYLSDEFVRCQESPIFKKYRCESALIAALSVFKDIRTKVNLTNIG